MPSQSLLSCILRSLCFLVAASELIISNHTRCACAAQKNKTRHYGALVPMAALSILLLGMEPLHATEDFRKLLLISVLDYILQTEREPWLVGRFSTLCSIPIWDSIVCFVVKLNLQFKQLRTKNGFIFQKFNWTERTNLI